MMSSWVAILAAAFITYFLRFSGLLLAGRMPETGRFKTFMGALPGTILLSLVIPPAIAGGGWSWVATACTAIVSWRTGNVFLAMIIGVAIVALSRLHGA